jgi:SAM-dependent methyltransferase
MDLAREKILAKVLPGVGSACDLGCGTGTTALSLAKQGIRMFAVDLSPGMCRVAREKAKRAAVPLRVIRSDMRTFRLPEPVDLILCEFDALNHVPSKSGLDMVARSAAGALNRGGYFFFDVNHRPGFQSYWRGAMWVEQPGVVLVMRNGNNAENDRAWCDVEWFIKEGTLWRRHREHVEEVCWSGEEIQKALTGAGFDHVRAWDATPFFNQPEIRPGCRSVYLARKTRGA